MPFVDEGGAAAAVVAVVETGDGDGACEAEFWCSLAAVASAAPAIGAGVDAGGDK